MNFIPRVDPGGNPVLYKDTSGRYVPYPILAVIVFGGPCGLVRL